MVILYFSGTGNTKYLSERFSTIMESECFSIEDRVDFKEIIAKNETIAFSYPVYGSCVPEIMREFVIQYKSYLQGKRIIIFCTQMMFSGDGARVFTELLEGINVNVVYAEHFNMPNNICNFFLFPVKSREKAGQIFKKTDIKLEKACHSIKNGIIKKRGFNLISKYIGLISQRKHFVMIENRAKKDVRINADCIGCSRCVKLCPQNNLAYSSNQIQQKGKCTLCYRCVNLCPQKAITVLVHAKVKKQYNGISCSR